jgi:hypothetical protein
VAAQEDYLREFDLVEEAVGIVDRGNLRGNGSG